MMRDDAFDTTLRQIGPLTGMAMALGAAQSLGLDWAIRRHMTMDPLAPEDLVPAPRGLRRAPRLKPEQPNAKRIRKAQRAARKARRRGEGS